MGARRGRGSWYDSGSGCRPSATSRNVQGVSRWPGTGSGTCGSLASRRDPRTSPTRHPDPERPGPGLSAADIPTRVRTRPRPGPEAPSLECRGDRGRNPRSQPSPRPLPEGPRPLTPGAQGLRPLALVAHPPDGVITGPARPPPGVDVTAARVEGSPGLLATPARRAGLV